MDDKNKDNIIDISSRLPDLDDEFSSENDDWEEHIETCLEQHFSYIANLHDQLKLQNDVIEDLNRDIQDLKRCYEKLIRQLYIDRKKNIK